MSLLRKIFGFPIAIIWWLVSSIRNTLFNWDVFTSQQFDLPVIGVGNLSMGGSGKTPHTEYLLELLHDNHPVAVLSRGYKRKTTGYMFASTQSTVKQIGDEPLQFKLKYPQVPVAVSESRVLGIPQLLIDAPNTEVILLDDVFQHRSVNPGLQILLTDFHAPYTSDFVFPSGNLRESRQGAKRADIIIVTKCPIDLSQEQRQQFIDRISPEPQQSVFFTCFHYGQPYSLYNPDHRLQDTDQELLLVTGIAKPEYLQSYVASAYGAAYLKQFADHYQFEQRDLQSIKETYDNLGSVKKSILVTEKDAVKLSTFSKDLQNMQLPVFVQPIRVRVLFNEQERLNKEVINFVENFYNAHTS